jgi:GNAT superfamily N-acetyltransferase
MAWTITANPDEYLAQAGEFLRADPVRYTIELAVIEKIRAAPPARPGAVGSGGPMFGWWRRADGDLSAVVLHTPPYPLLLGGLPAGSGAELAARVAGLGRQLPGVNGPRPDAARFAAAWHERTGAGSVTVRRSQLYRLGRLVPPDPAAAGAPRVAGQADRGLLEQWHAAFAAEINDVTGPQPGDVADRLSYGGLTLWEDGARPVAMAGQLRPSAGVVRVGPVYTPAGLRGRGYGAAVTAAVTSAALQAGAGQVVLFTDIANPVSNALYRRLGYQPVAEMAGLRFAPPGG